MGWRIATTFLPRLRRISQTLRVVCDFRSRDIAAACGARYAVGVANGTDAIALLLRAADIGPGDEVIVPAMTAAFTALAVTSIGAVPVIVDIDPARMAKGASPTLVVDSAAVPVAAR